MMGLNGFSRLVLRLANRLAGKEREDWVLAMAVETDAAERHSTRWALGCLYAAAKDRLARDRWFVALIIALPALAIVLAVASAMMIFIGARALDVSGMAGIPIMLLAPVPAAWLLGRMRPGYSVVVVGTAAFLVHQATPLIAMWALFGTLPPFWSPNMIYYNIPAYGGLLISWLVWVAATWWGAHTPQSSVA